MLIINKYNDGSMSLLQGNNLGSAIPVHGDIQKLIRDARVRREPVIEREIKA